MQKLYVYVDESGQDTGGRLFIVAIIISSERDKETIEAELIRLESSTGKRLLKWKKTRPKVRRAYLELIAATRILKGSVLYAVYKESKEYLTLITASVVKALAQRSTGEYRAFITIDGLNAAQERNVTEELKRYRVPYRRVSGARDEASACVRFADAIAGFIRDHEEEAGYTHELFRLLEQAGVIQKM